MKLLKSMTGLLLGIVLAILGARARAQSSAEVTVGGESVAAVTDQVEQLYAQAKPYVNDPLPDLQRAVPDLRSLIAAGTEANLQSILDRTGKELETQVPKISDLTANESIAAAGIRVGTSSDDRGAGRGRSSGERMLGEYTSDERLLEEQLHVIMTTRAPRKDFDYMVSYRQALGGPPTLEESRTDLKAPSSMSQEEEQELHGVGFAHLWLMFLPVRIQQSTYRLLGEEKMYGHETYVLAFAQSPDRVILPGQISANGRTYPLLYQGILWIDETNFCIVRLRADLLAPLPEIQVRWLSSDLQFEEVRIPELNLPLWLPYQVELMWRQANELGGEMHVYTNYRLFHATARILPPSQSSGAVTVEGKSLGVLAPDPVKQIYAQTKPYMNDSLRDLQRAVPYLRRLKAAGTEVNLQSILDRTGEAVETQIPKIPDLMASESIAQGVEEALIMPSPATGDTGVEYTKDERQLEEQLHSTMVRAASKMDFNYLVFNRPTPGGHATLEESRTDAKGQNSRQSQEEEQKLHGIGFAHLWFIFLPERIPQSDYRLLGEEKMDGHETYVLAFAQSKDRALPGRISGNGRTYPMFYQGVAWIDETTFRIVRLRADLLAPLPDIQVQWFSSDLQFKEVRIPELNLPLWLPHQVELMWRVADDIGGEMHVYTKYRLFHATARMLPPS